MMVWITGEDDEVQGEVCHDVSFHTTPVALLSPSCLFLRVIFFPLHLSHLSKIKGSSPLQKPASLQAADRLGKGSQHWSCPRGFLWSRHTHTHTHTPTSFYSHTLPHLVMKALLQAVITPSSLMKLHGLMNDDSWFVFKPKCCLSFSSVFC